MRDRFDAQWARQTPCEWRDIVWVGRDDDRRPAASSDGDDHRIDGIRLRTFPGCRPAEKTTCLSRHRFIDTPDQAMLHHQVDGRIPRVTSHGLRKNWRRDEHRATLQELVAHESAYLGTSG